MASGVKKDSFWNIILSSESLSMIAVGLEGNNSIAVQCCGIQCIAIHHCPLG